jgi:adenosylcobinamide-phosphate synthase
MHYIFAAFFLDALLGDPARVPHPVVGVGWVVHFWERCFYPQVNKKRGGVFFCAAVLATVGAIAGVILFCASFMSWVYGAAVAYLLYAAIAWRSLKDESLPVALALFGGDLETARTALSRIVGRDTRNLDGREIARAAIETIGENFIDGVFSVLFFMVLGYVCGGAAGAVLASWFFRTANTLDSMVGYDNERYHDFGRASAYLDDILNFVPARFGGMFVLLAGACLGCSLPRGMRIFLRDRKKHKSPNSAHGESAFAGLLGVRLGGGAVYGGVFEDRPMIGDVDFRDPEPVDILRAHAILDASVAFSLLLLLFASLFPL